MNKDKKRGGKPRKSKKTSPTRKVLMMQKAHPNYTGLPRNPLLRFWGKTKEILQFKKENKI
jgi:hypothetical protein